MKIILKILFAIVTIFLIFVLHMTFIGIETDRFNNQIKNKVKDINKNLDVDLKEIKIILDPIQMKLNIKTVGSEFEFNKKIIELESIKSQISLISFFQKEYSLENLHISTKSLDIKNLIPFIRKFKNTTELFILEKIIKKGYVIADLNLNFDKSGKIKKDFQINGLIKDLKADILKDYKIEKLDLIYEYKQDNLIFQNINTSINDKNLNANKILVKKEKKIFL